MQNFVQTGHNLTVTAPADVTSGELVAVGSIIGVATNDASEGDTLVLAVEGVFDVKKTSAEAYTVGEPLFYNPTGAIVTSDSNDAAHPLCAIAVQAAANPSSIARVKLIGFGLTADILTALTASG
jgi:predicted RecA/RadA family phage recombinase